MADSNKPIIPGGDTVGTVGEIYLSENGKTYECVAVIDNSTVKPNGEKLTKKEYVWVCTDDGTGGASGSEALTFTITPVDGQVSPTLSATRAEMLAAIDAGKTVLGYWTETRMILDTTDTIKHEFRLESVSGTGASRGLAFVNYEQFYKSTLYVNGNDTVSFVDKERLPIPTTKTDAMTQSVGMDNDGRLWTEPGASGLPEGATAFQQLVTDHDGNTVWTDRPGGYTQKFTDDYVYTKSDATNAFYKFCQQHGYKIGDTITVVCNGVTYENVPITANDKGTVHLEQAGVFSFGNVTYYGGGNWGGAYDTFPDGVTSVTFKDVPYEIDVEVPEKYLSAALEKKLNTSGGNVSGELSVIGEGACLRIENEPAEGENANKLYHTLSLGPDNNSVRAYGSPIMSGGSSCLQLNSRGLILELTRLEDISTGAVEDEGHVFFNYPVTIQNVATPSFGTDAANMKYVDDTKLIVSSSTAGSTKKFKITVDDAGTLTATEITTA